MCSATAVAAACPEPPGHPGCERIFCGGRLWRNQTGVDGLITYRIDDPAGQFSDAYKSAIRGAADAWTAAREGFAKFKECQDCSGRSLTVVPGTGDGIVISSRNEELLPMPVVAGFPVTVHRIAHEWGHAIGLGHTYERADRDRHVRFDPAVWCGPQRSGLPPRCALGPDEPGFPPVPSDTFGVYDELSKMNGFAIDGICGDGEPDPASGMPTDGDGSAVQELYMGRLAYWAPFQPITRSNAPTAPPDYQLADGVDPVGSPAITEWTAPAVEIFVRGTDGSVYATRNELLGLQFMRWAQWEVVAGAGTDADPAVVLADASTLHLVVRAPSDQSIRLSTRANGTWGPWKSLGAPSVGAASAPAISARANRSPSVTVLGRDGLLSVLTCSDPTCSTITGGFGAWSRMPSPPPGALRSKPAMTFISSGTLLVTAVGSDDNAWVIGSDTSGVSFSASVWSRRTTLSLRAADPNPGVAIQAYLDDYAIFARNPRGRLVNSQATYQVVQGGILTGPPAATSARSGQPWAHVAALIDDHGHPGVWVKWYGEAAPGQQTYDPPCNYNQPGTCGQCGCDIPSGPMCDL